MKLQRLDKVEAMRMGMTMSREKMETTEMFHSTPIKPSSCRVGAMGRAGG